MSDQPMRGTPAVDPDWTPAQQSMEHSALLWTEAVRKEEGRHAGSMAIAAIARAEEVAADLAALTERVEMQSMDILELARREADRITKAVPE